MGESGRETLETKRRGGGGYLFQVGAALKPNDSSVSARFEDLFPPPLPPLLPSACQKNEGCLRSTTWHYAAVNVQITPHLLHSKQRSFNDTRTGGTVVNFSPADHLARSLPLFYERPREETKSKNAGDFQTGNFSSNKFSYFVSNNRTDSIFRIR